MVHARQPKTFLAMQSNLIEEFRQINEDFKNMEIKIKLSNYFERSEKELTYCAKDDENYLRADCFRLASAASKMHKISKLKAYCKIWKVLKGNTTYLSGKKAHDGFLTKLYGTPKAQPVEHAFDHLRNLVPVPIALQELGFLCQAKYANIFEKKINTSHISECEICKSSNIWTYFATLCALRMIEIKEVDVKDLNLSSDVVIWDIFVDLSEETLDSLLDDKQKFKEYVTDMLTSWDVKNNMVAYSDVFGVKDSLLQYLKDCCRAFKPYTIDESRKKYMNNLVKGSIARFHTPYMTIIQSSGVGKTRLVLELRNDVILVYLCLRSSLHSGIPPRSHHADFFDTLIETKHFLAYFLAFFNLYLAWATEYLESKDVKKGNLSSFLQASYHKISDSDDPKDAKLFWAESLRKKNHTELFTRITEGVGNIRKVIEKGLEISAAKVPMFLFAYDEASSMLNIITGINTLSSTSQFLTWRTSIAYLPAGQCFCVLLDTSSKLSKFAPAKDRDPSKRISHFGYMLYSPCFWISFRGEFSNSEVESNKEYCKLIGDYVANVPGPKGSVIIIRPYQSILLSRAMFVNYLIGRENFADWPAMLHSLHGFASTKLLGSKEKPKTIYREGPFRSAVAACLLDSVPLDSDLIETLVANHMATLYYVAADRTFFGCKYVPEPVIGAIAASQLLSEKEYIIVAEEIRLRLARGELGYLNDTGNVAEIATCISLLYSNSLCFNNRRTKMGFITDASGKQSSLSSEAYMVLGAPVPLLDFLKEIYPNTLYDSLPTTFERSFVRFHRWIRLRAEDILDSKVETKCFLSKKALFEAFQNQCAIILPPQFPAIDLAIPIAYSENMTFEASEANMTYIGVQVKGWKNGMYRLVRESCRKAMKIVHSTTNNEGPKVLMLVQLGKGGMGRILEQEQLEIITRDKQPNVTDGVFLQIPSLSILCRHRELCKKLDELVDIKKVSEKYLEQYFANLHVLKKQKRTVSSIISNMLQLLPIKAKVHVAVLDKDMVVEDQISRLNSGSDNKIVKNLSTSKLKGKKVPRATKVTKAPRATKYTRVATATKTIEAVNSRNTGK